MSDKGWQFVESENELEGSEPEKLYGSKYLREIYFRANPDYDGRFTVPVLWDKKTETIVNNESRLRPRNSGVLMAVRLFGCFILLLMSFCQRINES